MVENTRVRPHTEEEALVMRDAMPMSMIATEAADQIPS